MHRAVSFFFFGGVAAEYKKSVPNKVVFYFYFTVSERRNLTSKKKYFEIKIITKFGGTTNLDISKYGNSIKTHTHKLVVRFVIT